METMLTGSSSLHWQEPHAATEGMVFVPGGTFRMGSDRHYPEEAPVHRVTVDGFWMDRTPVTNRQFSDFVRATGHVTFAEIAPDPKDYPGALPHMLYAGSLVFTPPAHPVDLRDSGASGGRLLKGANWRHPYGPKSNIHGLDNHPVVHVTFRRRARLCAWAGKDLPTEAEWEFAARGGLDGAEFAWGDDFTPGGRTWPIPGRANSRTRTSAQDGYERTSPVTAFPPNGYGLHDMIGNVWEWTTDWYSPKHPADAPKACCIPENPRGGREEAQLRPAPTRRSGSRARSSRAARICARPTTAAATARPRATRNRSTRPRATSVSDASCERATDVSRLGGAPMLMTILTKLPNGRPIRWQARKRAGGLDAPVALIGATLARFDHAGAASAQAPTSSKPNILFIVSDDTGYGDLGPYGGGEGRGMPTPEHRPAGGGGHDLLLVLRPAELHARPRRHADRPHPEPQRHDHRGVPGPGRRTAGGRMDARLGAEAGRLPHLLHRQMASRRGRLRAAQRPGLRRDEVLRALSPQRLHLCRPDLVPGHAGGPARHVPEGHQGRAVRQRRRDRRRRTSRSTASMSTRR